jgi:hypothetical protein
VSKLSDVLQTSYFLNPYQMELSKKYFQSNRVKNPQWSPFKITNISSKRLRETMHLIPKHFIFVCHCSLFWRNGKNLSDTSGSSDFFGIIQKSWLFVAWQNFDVISIRDIIYYIFPEITDSTSCWVMIFPEYKAKSDSVKHCIQWF